MLNINFYLTRNFEHPTLSPEAQTESNDLWWSKQRQTRSVDEVVEKQSPETRKLQEKKPRNAGSLNSWARY